MIDVNYWKSLPHFGDAMRANEKEVKEAARQEVLIEILNAHFGYVPDKTIRAIQSLHDPQKLKVLVRKSLRAESLAEVQKLLAKSKSKSNGHNGKKRANSRQTV